MKKMRKLTMKETLKDKTASIIILTIILTIAINKLVKGFLTREEIIGEGLYSSRTIHFSLGIYGLIFAIPASLLSTLIVMFFMNKVKRQTYSYNDEINFKWYSIYGTVSGYVILFLLVNLTNTYASQILVSDVWDAVKHLAVLFIIPIVFALIFAKSINKIMMRITNTNGGLIQEIEAGRHDEEFVGNDNKTRVLKLLKKGNVHTIKGGLFRLKTIDFLFMFVNVIIFVLWILVSKLIPNLNEKRYQGTGEWNDGQTKLNQQYQERKRLKSEAYDTAENKWKQANFSKKMFIKTS